MKTATPQGLSHFTSVISIRTILQQASKISRKQRHGRTRVQPCLAHCGRDECLMQKVSSRRALGLLLRETTWRKLTVSRRRWPSVHADNQTVSLSPHTAHCAICRVNKQRRFLPCSLGPSAYPKSILGRYCNTIGYEVSPLSRHLVM